MHVLRLVFAGERAAVAAAGAGDPSGAGTTAEHHRTGSTVEFRNGDHDGAFNGHQAAIRAAPLSQCLKLHRLRGQIRHIQPGEHFLGSFGVIVSRATNQRKACQRNHGINDRFIVLEEETIDSRPCIQTCREHRNNAQTAGLQRSNHGVIVTRITRQQVGAQQQQAHGAGCSAARSARQQLHFLAHPAWHARVIHTDFGVIDRRRYLE